MIEVFRPRYPMRLAVHAGNVAIQTLRQMPHNQRTIRREGSHQRQEQLGHELGLSVHWLADGPRISIVRKGSDHRFTGTGDGSAQE